ncbi:MAG: hypothetical protein D6740_07485 [Alphaproteobacteria bacterium]|nr:MAG: hypothetical protein D6740_07485 [Alphaproteobacteria bacterium]
MRLALAGAVGLLGGLVARPVDGAHAAELRLTPFGGLSLAATSNVFLEPTARQEDFSSQLEAGFGFTANGARFRANVQYFADYLYFARTGRDKLQHDGSGILRYDVLPRILRIEATGVVREAFTSRAGVFSGSRANLAQGRQTVQGYQFGPDLSFRLGSLAEFQGQYRFSLTLNDSGRKSAPANRPVIPFSDSHGHQVSLDLAGSRDRLRRLEWRLFGRFNRTVRSRPPQNVPLVQPVLPVFQTAQGGLDLAYVLTRAVRLEGSVGYFTTNTRFGTSRLRGLRWDAGVRLKGPRLELGARIGRRAGQTTIEATSSYRLRHLSVSARYTDIVGSSQQLLLDDALRLTAPRLDTNQPVLPPGFTLEPNVPLLAPPGFDFSDRNFRQRRAAVELAWTRRRESAQLTGSWERRRFEDGSLARGFGVDLTIGHQMTRRATWVVEGSLRHDRFETGTRTDNNLIVATGGNWTIARNLTGEIRYTFSKRFSNLPDVTFAEHALFAGLRIGL